MGAYVTTEDIETQGFQIAERDKDRLEPLCEMCSRFFDMACGLPAGYFAPSASGATATSRDFWGDGTELLKLDPYNGTPTVTMPTGWTVPDYVELTGQTLRSDGFNFGLIRTYGDSDTRVNAFVSGSLTGDSLMFNQFYSPIGWPEGIKVSVSAIWGYSAIPFDVKLAVIETTIAALRGVDQAYARVTNLETNTVTNAGALTPRAQLIAERYNHMRVNFA